MSNQQDRTQGRILVADDEPGIRRTIKIILEKSRGYSVDEAENGEQALTMLAEKGPYDLVILDQMMPKLEGVEVLVNMRAKGWTTPTIMVTAHSNMTLAVKFMREGGSDFIEKPLDHQVLLLKVERVLEKARLEQEYDKACCQLRLLSKAIETVQVGVTITDLQSGTIVYTNQAEAKIHGCEVSDLVGRDASVLAPSELAQPVSGEERYSLAGKSLNRRLDNNKTFPVYLITDVVRDPEGKATHVVTVCEDISELERLRQAEISQEATRQANRTKGDFLGKLGHEARNLLSVILGNAELMKEHGSLTSQQESAIRNVMLSGEVMLRLMNDILDLTRIEARQLTLKLEKLSLRELLKSCESMANSLARKKGVTLFSQECPDLCLLADRSRLQQAIFNLLQNAVKFTDQGGTVRIETRCDDMPFVWISIIDNGKGIDRKDIPRLFLPFEQVDKALGGAGLGLTLVKSIVELHNGNVEVASVPGQGSRFTIILPNTEEKIVKKEFTHEKKNNIGKLNCKILIVEDEESLRNMFAVFFRNHFGCEVVCAGTGEECLKMSQHENPEVIIMDIKMPGISGWETIRRLRSNPKTANICILTLTGLASEEDRNLSLKAGADAFLPKPVILKELYETIKKLLAEKAPK